jgi:hypothetical protein
VELKKEMAQLFCKFRAALFGLKKLCPKVKEDHNDLFTLASDYTFLQQICNDSTSIAPAVLKSIVASFDNT